MWRLHMQYLGSRVDVKMMLPSGRWTGSISDTFLALVSCCAPDPSDGHRTIAPVGQYPEGASPFGLLDMAGNVWEWTSSPFPGRRDKVALRGGGWGNNSHCLRASYRHANPPNLGLDMVGFRCAAD